MALCCVFYDLFSLHCEVCLLCSWSWNSRVCMYRGFSLRLLVDTEAVSCYHSAAVSLCVCVSWLSCARMSRSEELYLPLTSVLLSQG